MPAQVGGDDTDVRQVFAGQRLPASAVPGEAVQGEHQGAVGRAESMDVEIGHATIVPRGPDKCGKSKECSSISNVDAVCRIPYRAAKIA
ncbi:hypothetical protein GCM10027089_58530 [Nocardia thraciensis]